MKLSRFWLLAGWCLGILIITNSFAQTQPIVEHYDAIEEDQKLTLSQLVNLTVAKHPEQEWLQALETEAKALQRRGDSWIAGAVETNLRYQEATSGTLHYIDAGVQIPIWNIGQRQAERQVAYQAQLSAGSQTAVIRLKIAGLIRFAIWDIALQKLRYQQTQTDLKNFETLLIKVKRRVVLGDLPKMDELLMQTELLQKRSALVLAEAEVMHSRKRYISLTQTHKIPLHYRELLVSISEIQNNHPALIAINHLIERKQAEIQALAKVGSGQSNLAIGINSDRPSNQDSRSNNTESFNIGITIPFAGEAHLAPQLAALYVELNQLIAEQHQLHRDLELAHHEAEHNLAVNRAEMEIATELKQVAEQHLKMTELSFSVGETDLLDLLKIQARTQQAVLNAQERALILQRDYAFYNQSVGVSP